MLRYVRGAELPDTELWWRAGNNSLANFSSGVLSWEVKIVDRRRLVLLEKTTGVTGAAGSGTQVDGVPNVTIEWDEDDLDIAPGKHKLQLKAHTSAGDLYLVCPFEIVPVS